ncbi:MAG: formyltetrahydrofolate deformylase [Nitrospirae bacterium]|nr:formyltetrahydrofolate deformylase [Nitrospirota bacterium]
MDNVILLISCPDQKGIVAAVSNFILAKGGNILQSDQHTTDPRDGIFFMRVAFDLSRSHTPLERESLEKEFASSVADRFRMDWRIRYARDVKRMAIMVSREGHCLVDLLWRWKTGELKVEIPCVVSNHPDLAETVQGFGIPFYVFPVTPETKQHQENSILAYLDGKVDFIVLARYMQVLTKEFVSRYPHAILNIHHSFLPAFAGGKPYEQALERGVKVIGATAHYATETLDEGPIIEQDVVRVTHRDGLADLIRKGRDEERAVLARAVQWHIEDRILVYRNRTVVFV